MENTVFDSEYNRLNAQQKEAVNSIYWPIMVVAWPGTGKTQIIGLRTANIILKTWVSAENILITTFTDAWVIAIRERLLKFLGNDAYKVNVSTIHSLSQDIIKTFPEKFLEYKAGTPIDDVDSLEVIKAITDKLVKEKQIEALTTDYDKYFYLRDIKARISNLKQEWINSSRLKILTKKQEEKYTEELAEIKPTLKKYETTKEKQAKHIAKLNELYIFFNEYNSYLRENSFYDFNDMINFVLERLKEDNELKHHYAEKFQFIMLDEYQDTNDAQNQIIDLILSVSDEKPNIMTVGDDDQSIYRFQGANIENMLDFATKYQDTQFIVLEHNYRSNQQILNLSSQLIENNNERLSNKITSINKKLISSWELRKSTTVPGVFKASSDIEEKTFIVNQIKNLIKSGQEINEIAVIVRWNKEVKEWSQLLEQNQIETESKLKTNILNSKYVNLILDYLDIINNPYTDEEKLVNLMRTSLVWLNQIDVLKINRELYIKNYSRKFNLTLMDFLTKMELEEQLEDPSFLPKEEGIITSLRNPETLIEFRDNLLNLQSKNSELSIVEFFSHFIEVTWLLTYIEIHWTFDDIQDIYTLFNKIKSYTNLDNNFTVTKLLQKIDLYKTYNYSISRQIITENKAWVQILTAHSSKWLEYNNVFIPGLYNWNWEGKRVINRLKLPDNIAWDWLQESNFEQIEEDRRLFFVAVTRAKENLFLSYPAWIWTKPLIQSIFIEEIEWEIFILPPFNKEKSENIKVTIPEIIKNDIKNDLIEYNSLEFDYIIKFLETYKLSPSDLNTFLEEPMDFLNRAVFKYPFVDNQYTIFGKVYHRTLELFYLKYKAEWILPEKTYLTTTFSAILNKEVLTPEEHEKLTKKGIAWLDGYYDLYNSKANEIVELEYSFRRKNLSFNWIPLTGTIDKIEKIQKTIPLTPNKEIATWEQSPLFIETVALIDYKTWKTKTLGQIKGLDRYWNKKEWEGKYFRQLMFYKLLCEQDEDFNSRFNIWAVALDFVEGKDWNYKYIELDISDEEYENFKEELVEAREKISNIEFWKDILNKKKN